MCLNLTPCSPAFLPCFSGFFRCPPVPKTRSLCLFPSHAGNLPLPFRIHCCKTSFWFVVHKLVITTTLRAASVELAFHGYEPCKIPTFPPPYARSLHLEHQPHRPICFLSLTRSGPAVTPEDRHGPVICVSPSSACEPAWLVLCHPCWRLQRGGPWKGLGSQPSSSWRASFSFWLP